MKHEIISKDLCENMILKKKMIQIFYSIRKIQYTCIIVNKAIKHNWMAYLEAHLKLKGYLRWNIEFMNMRNFLIQIECILKNIHKFIE